MNVGSARWLATTSGILTAVMALATAGIALFDRDSVALVFSAVAAGALAIVAMITARSCLSESDQTVAHQRGKVFELESEVQQFRRSIDSLADGLDVAVIVGNSQAHILYANRRFGEMFGFTSVLGRSLLEVTLSYDLEQTFKETVLDGEPRTLEVSLSYPSDRVVIARLWRDPDNPEQAFLSLAEISNLRRLERIRQDFVANVSHELRTPMTIIRSMAETLLDEVGDQSELNHRFLNKIIAEVDRLNLISEDLLNLSDAESNLPRKHETDIADIFRSVVQQLQSAATEKGLTLTFTGLPALSIHANASQMRQVALNLVDNAIKYTPSGSVSVEVSLDGDRAKIVVRDTGLGIAEEHLPRIFERFYRVDKARSRESGGTGLGLSIVKHIVESHGGQVTVDSRLNHGSTFSVYLPEN